MYFFRNFMINIHFILASYGFNPCELIVKLEICKTTNIFYDDKNILTNYHN